MKDLYAENDKTLLKETKDNKCNDILCSQIIRTDFVKMPTIFKDTHSFKTVPNWILMEYFSNEKKKILKLTWATEDSKYPKQSWETKAKSEASHFWIQAILPSYGNQSSIVLT